MGAFLTLSYLYWIIQRESIGQPMLVQTSQFAVKPLINARLVESEKNLSEDGENWVGEKVE